MEVKELSLHVPMSPKSNIVKVLDHLNHYLNHGLAVVAGVAMVSMMLLIVANVLFRVISAPIVGITEMVGWLAAVTASLSLGYTQIYRGHVDIDILVERFPPKIRILIQALMTLLSFIFFSFLFYHFVKFAISTMESGVLSQTLGIVYYPVILIVSIGFFGLSLSLFVDFLKICTGGGKK